MALYYHLCSGVHRTMHLDLGHKLRCGVGNFGRAMAVRHYLADCRKIWHSKDYLRHIDIARSACRALLLSSVATQEQEAMATKIVAYNLLLTY